MGSNADDMDLAKEETVAEEDGCDFVLDTTGALDEEKPEEQLDEEEGEEEEKETGVNYSLDASISEAQLGDETPSNTPGGAGGGGWATCYNCQGRHNIRSCPHPSDDDRIELNMMRNDVMGGIAGRMGEFKPAPVLYPYVKPGKISFSLRDAMGLTDEELPPHVYTMRCVGYPPGWLKKAKILKERLGVFQGDDVASEDAAKPMFDRSKIFEYPGFNAPVPSGAYDDHERYNCPPLMDHNMIENWEPALKFATSSDLEECDDPVEESPFKNGNADLTCEEDEENYEAEMSCDPVDVSHSVPSFDVLNPEPVVDEDDDIPIGAPIPAKKPALGRWTSNISEHIPFENLPGATGNYEMLRRAFNRYRTDSAAEPQLEDGEAVGRSGGSVDEESPGRRERDDVREDDEDNRDESAKHAAGRAERPRKRKRAKKPSPKDDEVEEGELDDDE